MVSPDCGGAASRSTIDDLRESDEWPWRLTMVGVVFVADPVDAEKRV